MFTKVRIKKPKLDYFRKLAREAYPLEMQAFLLGHVKSINEIEVTDFVYTKYYRTQTREEVSWTAEEYERVKQKAEAEGKIIVGDSHSHPSWDSVKSPQDHLAQIKDNLILCGICSVNGKRTRIHFWNLTSSLPLEVYYT